MKCSLELPLLKTELLEQMEQINQKDIYFLYELNTNCCISATKQQQSGIKFVPVSIYTHGFVS